MDSKLSPDEDRHLAAQELLPWYVTDRLDADERALVEAHLASCAECREELADERALAAAAAADAEALPAVDGWAAMAARLAAPDPPALPAAAPRRRTRGPWRALRRVAGEPRALRWVVAAQFAAVLVLGGQLLAPAPDAERPAPYRVLGDAPGERSGNVLAMFRPETRESAMRRALQASGARLVDGPTAAGAYVLAVPGGATGAALATLRRDNAVTMAEPIEQAPAE